MELVTEQSWESAFRGKKAWLGDHGDSGPVAKATWAPWPGGVLKWEGPSVAPAVRFEVILGLNLILTPKGNRKQPLHWNQEHSTHF